MRNIAHKPIQKNSYKEKIKDDFAWAKDTMEWVINQSSFYNVASKEERDLGMLYGVYNNVLPESLFHYVTNPLNSTKKEFTQFPAKLREYTILRPNIDLLLGEYHKRPFNYTVKVNNPDSVNIYQEELKKQIKSNLENLFINELVKAKPELQKSNPEELQAMLPQEVVNAFNNSYKDKRAELGQTALEYIEDELYVHELWKDLFKDWLIAGESYTYKEVRRDDIFYERVSPLEIDFDKSPSIQYIEDSNWVARRSYMSVSEIVDKFYDEIKATDIDYLEKESNTYSHSFNDRMYQKLFTEDRSYDKIEVIHITWKTFRRIGILYFVDELGQEQEQQVDEDYKVNKELGEQVEWYWVTEAWEGYRVDDKFHLGIRPIRSQRNKMNHLSSCKLPYNGKRYSDTHTRNISILELGLPYQILYIILHYRLELLINKSKGKIALIDSNVIPRGGENKNGYDEESFFYYSDALGFGLIDRNQIGVDKSYNQYQVLDMSLYDHISKMIELMMYVKQEWDDVLGITRQRKGQVMASDSVGGTDRAVFQSSVITEEIFQRFQYLEQRELQGLLDLSKLAWINGKKSMYIGSDMRTQFLNVVPEDYISLDFGIKVSNASKDIDDLRMAKQIAQSLAQSGNSKASTILELVRSNNYSKVTSIMKDLEIKEQQLAQQQSESEEQGKQETVRIQKEYELMMAEMEMLKMNAEYDRKERIELIKGDIQLQMQDLNNNGIVDINEVEKRAIEREKLDADINTKGREQSFRERELELKRKEIETKAATEKYKADKSLEIAKQNKNKHDK